MSSLSCSGLSCITTIPHSSSQLSAAIFERGADVCQPLLLVAEMEVGNYYYFLIFLVLVIVISGSSFEVDGLECVHGGFFV